MLGDAPPVEPPPTRRRATAPATDASTAERVRLALLHAAEDVAFYASVPPARLFPHSAGLIADRGPVYELHSTLAVHDAKYAQLSHTTRSAFTPNTPCMHAPTHSNTSAQHNRDTKHTTHSSHSNACPTSPLAMLRHRLATAQFFFLEVRPCAQVWVLCAPYWGASCSVLGARRPSLH